MALQGTGALSQHFQQFTSEYNSTFFKMHRIQLTVLRCELDMKIFGFAIVNSY